mmetsp:Transcript_159028/g.305031  ORF Transcript_159028/g.305031 Transcript_159028/m.305031 type:complete len:209 (-) Transcript_159028:40-666(-)
MGVSHSLTKNLRSPSNGCWGGIAIFLMRHINKASSEDMVQRTGISAGETVVELGPGEGFFLCEALRRCGPGLKLYGVEISERFRRGLAENEHLQDARQVEIRDEDARDMSAFLGDASVDKLVGMNVVYFLSPLDQYLQEFRRVLRPGGLLFLGCKWDSQRQTSSDIAVNKNEDDVVAALRAAGFDIQIEAVDLGDRKSNYTALKGIRL